MPRKFVSNLRFHEVLQTTIIRQITKGNEEIEKIKKIQSKTVGIVYKSLHVPVFVCVCVCLCVCVCVGYSCVLLCVDV